MDKKSPFRAFPLIPPSEIKKNNLKFLLKILPDVSSAFQLHKWGNIFLAYFR